MKESLINSIDNAQVKFARSVRDGKTRASIFIEGLRLCVEAFNSGLTIESVFYTDKILQDERGAALLHNLSNKAPRLNLVNEKVLSSISDTRTPQGIIIIAARPPAGDGGWGLGVGEQRGILISGHPPPPIPYPPLIVILHRVNNPANAGAIIRTSEAAGATGVIATEGTADLFSPKALRGAMGSTFRLPVWTGMSLKEILAWCSENRIHTVSTDAHAKVDYTEIDWRLPRALILGSEGSGLSLNEVSLTHDAIKIPMHEPVESLNVAVACGIILYEAARQRTA